MIKKVAIVTDVWYPAVDGVVRSIDATKRELEKRGIEVAIIHPGLFRTLPMPLEYQVRLAFFPRPRMRRLLRDGRFDAIHIETEGPMGWAARAVCREFGFPYTTMHQTRIAIWVRSRVMPGLDRFIYAYLRKFHSRAARMMVSTPSFRDDLLARGFKNLRIRPLGVDADFFKPQPQAASLSYPKPVFTYLGRVAPEKNVEEFLKLDLPGTKLVIGAGEMFEKLRAAYPKAVFVGFKEKQDLVELLAGSDALVFPSRFDTFALVVLESLACGTPVAAHDEIGPRDLVTDGIDGYLSEDLKDAATKCLSLPRDAGRQKALQYTWQRSVDTLLANLAPIDHGKYQQALDSGRTSDPGSESVVQSAQ